MPVLITLKPLLDQNNYLGPVLSPVSLWIDLGNRLNYYSETDLGKKHDLGLGWFLDSLVNDLELAIVVNFHQSNQF